jgi:hypothetical protein
MEKCGEGVIDAASDVIVLGFELADSTLDRSPQMVIDLVQDKNFQKSIQKALEAEGKRLVKLQKEGKPVGNEEGGKVLAKVGNAAAKSSQLWVKNKIEKSSDYKALQKGLKKVECSFKESPVGVFIDENENLLIVVATGLAIGGAVAMYATRSGDWAAAQLAPLAAKQLRFKVLGKVELGAKKLVFKPSERKVELTTFTTAKWKSVKAKLDLNVGFKDDALTKSSATGEVVVDVAKGTSITGKGSIGYLRSMTPGEKELTYNLSLGMAFTGTGSNSKLKLQVLGHVSQDPTKRSVGGSGNLTYGITGGGGGAPGVNLTLGAKGGRTETFQPTGASKVQTTFETKLGVELTF